MTNPIEPSQALTIYLEHREPDLAPSSLRSYDYRLRHFVTWCEQQEITALNDVSPRDVHEYKQWRRTDGHKGDGEMSRPTVKSNMDCLRGFLRYMEKLEYAPDDLHDAAESPELRADENVSNSIVRKEKAEAILAHLDKFRYATREHTLFTIAWNTAARTGALRGLDLQDYDPDEQYLKFHHRPETETPLKNKKKGERLVALNSETCVVLDDYINENRTEKQDKHGRNPLLTTKVNGRMAAGTIRGWVYKMTCPRFYQDTCPHEGEGCRTHQNENYVYECPESTAPHSVRRGSITAMLEDDVPYRIVSERAQVSEAVLRKHYDKQSERSKMEQRRRFFR